MGKVGPINLSVLVQAPPSYRPFSRLAEDAIPKRLPRLTDNASLSSPKKSAGYTQPYNWIMAAGNCYLRGDEAREKRRAHMDDDSVFSSLQREQIRAELVASARTDKRIGGAAHLGSAALGLQDRWSDIDLALCLVPDAILDHVLVDWTTRLYRDHAAVASYDVKRGDILYRVFLLDNTLQIDLCRNISLSFGCGQQAVIPRPSCHVRRLHRHEVRLR